MNRGTRPPRSGRGRWLAGMLGGMLIAFAAWRIFARYGASDVSEAETIVLGMLLFILAAAGLAFLVVVCLKILRRLGGGRRPTLLDRDDA